MVKAYLKNAGYSGGEHTGVISDVSEESFRCSVHKTTGLEDLIY